MAQNFQVDTSDYLGFLYEEYLNKLTALAMSKPADFYDIRATVLKDLKQIVITNVYKEYYALLTTKDIGSSKNIVLIPHYPQQKASQFALQASKTINEILNSALDIILPPNHLDIAKMKLTEKGEASKIE